MTVPHEAPEAPGPAAAVGATVDLEVDVTGPLPGAAAALHKACDVAEDGGPGTVLTLWLSAGAAGGADWPGDTGIHDVNRWERAVRRLEGTRAATVAVAAGATGGPALDLLLAADHRIADRTLRLSLPGHGGLLWPGMSAHRLAHQLGAARARRLVLTDAAIPAGHALDLALVDEVVDDTRAAVDAAVARLSGVPGSELALRRRLLAEAVTTGYEEALGSHLAACDRELRRIRGTSEARA
ncbi:enoyl-CoA-hydratase DpgB [Streptomyces eurocidicus]|uniref:Isomerase DpgB n=1 Tax=Streptomyces eurocidicus TaxID=66423 RepID=A0A7W8F5T5_STREU|nr:enoyl-CoA-hydratase DpgB [Streptomyces eurocidicus]MBB5121696.1 isomerase DpgB [Streptomyces eurocidicus]